MLLVGWIGRAVPWELEEVLRIAAAEMASEGQLPLCPMATQVGQRVFAWPMLLSAPAL
jgi:hypothetical protein